MRSCGSCYHLQEQRCLPTISQSGGIDSKGLLLDKHKVIKACNPGIPAVYEGRGHCLLDVVLFTSKAALLRKTIHVHLPCLHCCLLVRQTLVDPWIVTNEVGNRKHFNLTWILMSRAEVIRLVNQIAPKYVCINRRFCIQSLPFVQVTAMPNSNVCWRILSWGRRHWSNCLFAQRGMKIWVFWLLAMIFWGDCFHTCFFF